METAFGEETIVETTVETAVETNEVEENSETQEERDVFIDEVDWQGKLNKDEIVEIDGKPCPKLVGLRRLAKPFIQSEYSQINFTGIIQKEVRRTLKRYGPANPDGKCPIIGMEEVIGHDHMPYASVTFTVLLKDGRQFTDSADAFLGNSNDYGNYPTAVASARAEGRVLRKVLGIQEHVYEEISSKDAIEELTNAEDRPIASEQKKFIQNKISDLDGFSQRDLLDKVSARDITSIDELTSAEAAEAIKTLNKLKKDSTKKK